MINAIAQKALRDSTLELQLKCNSEGKTIIARQYETHPLRISRPFRLDRGGDLAEGEAPNNHRAYLYLRNNSPGLFAGDELNLSLCLEEKTQLYLTEQSATKVHPTTMPEVTAKVHYQWTIAKDAMVEFIPEAIILYRDSALQQTTQVKIHPTASLFWSDLILPGRLARGECYQFRFYDHCLEVYSDAGELWFKDRMYLTGKDNPFSDSKLFASFPIWGNAIAIMPQIEVNLLKSTLDNLLDNNSHDLVAATSVLPHDKGVLIKVLASQTQKIKMYWHLVLNALRKLNHQSCLPHIPK
jgi:urease accessory protein